LFRQALINDVDPKQEARSLEIFNWRVQVIAESLVSYVFGSNMDWCTDEFQSADKCHIVQPFVAAKINSPLRDILSSPRPAAALPVNLIPDLHKIVKNYCHKVEKRNFTTSDLIIHGANGKIFTSHKRHYSLEDQLVAQVVKPALFELVLAGAIGAYLFVVYHIFVNSHDIIQFVVSKTKL
jgi:hypothetical protein